MGWGWTIHFKTRPKWDWDWAETTQSVQARRGPLQSHLIIIIYTLQWWKLNSTKYSFLSHMAHNILAIQVSTVASESTFSTGGRVVDQHMTSLKPNTVETLVCAQYWFSLDPTSDGDLDNDENALTDVLDILKEK